MLSPTGIKATPKGALTEQEKKTLINTLLFSMLCCGTVYLNVMSFFPLYVKDNFGEDKISSTMVSVAMSSFEFAGIITAPINASLISKIGRKTSIVIGFVIISFATFSLGALSWIETTEWRTFFYAAMATRFIQGYGDGLVVTTVFSLIGANFAEEKAKYYGLVEASIGFGLIIGPPMGSLLYGKFGYAWAFYSVSILMVFNVIFCSIMIPSKLNISSKNEVRNSLIESHDKAIQQRNSELRSSELTQGYNLLKKEDLTFGAILRVRESVFSYAASMIAMFCVSFYSSFMSL